MLEKLLWGDYPESDMWQRFVRNYPTLQTYMVEQSPLIAASARKPTIVPPYPTPLEVETLVKDNTVQRAYGVKEYFSTSDFLYRLPIHTTEQQNDGYNLFLAIDEKMQAKSKKAKVRRPTELQEIFFTHPGIDVYLPNFLVGLDQPIIEIGGPIPGWNFLHAPRTPIWVDYYPSPDVQFILDPRHMPFPSESLSLVFDNNTPWDIEREVTRVLEPNGIFISGGPQALEIAQKTVYGLEVLDVLEGAIG